MKYKIEFKGEFVKEKSKGVIALLDTSIILHNIRLGKNEAKFGAGLIDSLRALKLAIGVDYIYCIGDSGHSSYRKKLLENYKGDRKCKKPCFLSRVMPTSPKPLTTCIPITLRRLMRVSL